MSIEDGIYRIKDPTSGRMLVGARLNGKWATHEVVRLLKRIDDPELLLIERVDQETIILEGGPANGRSFGWRGGNTLEFVEEIMPGPEIVITPRPSGRVEHHVYRRAAYRPHVFIYEGARP